MHLSTVFHTREAHSYKLCLNNHRKNLGVTNDVIKPMNLTIPESCVRDMSFVALLGLSFRKDADNE